METIFETSYFVQKLLLNLVDIKFSQSEVYLGRLHIMSRQPCSRLQSWALFGIIMSAQMLENQEGVQNSSQVHIKMQPRAQK